MLAILGSGFGLYGYLPALVDGCAQRIVLPERYRSRFGGRPELARFANNVRWERDDATALDSADGAVVALRPSDQSEWIPRCLSRPNIECLLLEKPLAHSPEVAGTLYDDLIRSGKVFRIGYTFRYTAWGSRVLRTLRTPGESGRISIHWSFLAHHFRHALRTWKRSSATGGGVIRFYGIQVIALLAEIGYREVTFSRSFGASPDEVEKWTAVFSGPELPECDIVVDTRSTLSKFRVEQAPGSSLGISIVFADLCDPFDSEGDGFQLSGLDRRVPILSRLCRSLWEEGANEQVWYDATIKLWRGVEKKTRFATD